MKYLFCSLLLLVGCSKSVKNPNSNENPKVPVDKSCQDRRYANMGWPTNSELKNIEKRNQFLVQIVRIQMDCRN